MDSRGLIDKLRHIRSWKCNGDADMYATITAAIEDLEQQEQTKEAIPHRNYQYLSDY